MVVAVVGVVALNIHVRVLLVGQVGGGVCGALRRKAVGGELGWGGYGWWGRVVLLVVVEHGGNLGDVLLLLLQLLGGGQILC